MTLDEEKAALEKSRTNPSAFAPVYDHFYPKIFGYAMRRTGDYDLARDVAADTFLKAVLALPKFEHREKTGGLSAWLFQIATNELRQFFRRKKYASRVFGELPASFVLERKLHQIFDEERAQIEAQLAQNQDFVQAQRIIQTLDLKYQEVLALRFFEEKSIREIAEILAKPEGTVKSLLARGTQKIAQSLKRQPSNGT